MSEGELLQEDEKRLIKESASFKTFAEAHPDASMEDFILEKIKTSTSFGVAKKYNKAITPASYLTNLKEVARRQILEGLCNDPSVPEFTSAKAKTEEKQEKPATSQDEVKAETPSQEKNQAEESSPSPESLSQAKASASQRKTVEETLALFMENIPALKKDYENSSLDGLDKDSEEFKKKSEQRQKIADFVRFMRGGKRSQEAIDQEDWKFVTRNYKFFPNSNPKSLLKTYDSAKEKKNNNKRVEMLQRLIRYRLENIKSGKQRIADESELKLFADFIAREKSNYPDFAQSIDEILQSVTTDYQDRKAKEEEKKKRLEEKRLAKKEAAAKKRAEEERLKAEAEKQKKQEKEEAEAKKSKAKESQNTEPDPQSVEEEEPIIVINQDLSKKKPSSQNAENHSEEGDAQTEELSAEETTPPQDENKKEKESDAKEDKKEEPTASDDTSAKTEKTSDKDDDSLTVDNLSEEKDKVPFNWREETKKDWLSYADKHKKKAEITDTPEKVVVKIFANEEKAKVSDSEAALTYKGPTNITLSGHNDEIPDLSIFENLIASSKKVSKKIKFGEIQDADFSAKLMIACLRNPDVEMVNAPKVEDLKGLSPKIKEILDIELENRGKKKPNENGVKKANEVRNRLHKNSSSNEGEEQENRPRKPKREYTPEETAAYLKRKKMRDAELNDK